MKTLAPKIDNKVTLIGFSCRAGYSLNGTMYAGIIEVKLDNPVTLDVTEVEKFCEGFATGLTYLGEYRPYLDSYCERDLIAIN